MSPRTRFIIELLLFFVACAFCALSTEAVTRHQIKDTEHRNLLAKNAVAQPDYKMYLTKNDLLQQAASIANLNNKTFAVEVRHVSDGDYNVDVMVITVDLSGIGSSADGKVRHLIDFGQHGRELITSELGLRFLKTLADPSAIRAILLDGDAKNEADVIRSEDLYIKIRDHSVFKILPMENTRGRELVESGKLCERKNGRGVDPNRNWEVDWGKKEKDYDPAEEYPGTKPFSEPETQVVLDLAQSLKPHVWLNVHSGMEALFTPWDHVAEVPKAAQKALEVISQIKTEYFASNKDCVVGSGGKSVGYLAHGTATDYMFEKLKVPLPFTWEIFGDLDAAYNDCFKMFNPVDQKQFDATLKVWLKALFRLIELAPSHPEVAKELAAAKNLKEGISLSWPTHGNKTDSEPISHRHEDEGNGEVILVANSWIGSWAWDSLNWTRFFIGLLGFAVLIIVGLRYMRQESSSTQSDGKGRFRSGALPL